ncbi:cytokine receptor common subunit beta [Pogona vitticeps]
MRSWKGVLTLSLIFYTTIAREGPLLKNLNCSTDYESFTACTWVEHQEAKDLLNMTLLHKNDYLNLTKLACTSQKVGSLIRWDCCRNQTIFNIKVKNTFIFKPEQKLEVQKNISLFADVQPPPPQKLSINVTEEGDFLLAWEAGDGTNRSLWLEGVLDFEVAYKRIWETWKESSSFWVSNASHILLQHDRLVPGNTYVARVRSKPSQASHLSGHVSDWSPVVTWNTQPGEIEAQPKNLHCRFNGIDRLKCSWEVRKEVTSSVLFALFYKDNPESKEEEECFPVHEKKISLSHLGSSPEHVLQSCEINVTNPQRQSQYLVTVRPKQEEKVVEAAKQIKVNPPYKLSVTTLNSQAYRLEWQAKKTLHIPQMYQISYWKSGSPLEAKYVNVSKGDQWFIFTTNVLELGTSYTARVRAKVHGSYEGPWSEWSMEFHWTTDKSFLFWVIPLIAVISIILMMVGIYCGHEYLQRKKKEWEARIPTPPKTFLLPNFFQKVELLDGSEGDSNSSILELEGTGYTKILNRESLATHSASLQDELGETEQFSIFSQKGDKEIPSAGKVGQFLAQTITDNRPASSPKAQIFGSDGPNFSSQPESFPSDICQDREAASSQRKGISMWLENVGLPHCLESQQPPVEKEKGMPSSFSTIHGYEEEKQLPSARQKGSQSSKLEKEGNNGREVQHVAGTNSPCQNGCLNYIAIEHLSMSSDMDYLLPVPAVASEERRSTCDSMATGTPETIEDLSSLEMPEKKPETVLPAHSQSLAAPSAASHQIFDDYVTDLPAPPGLLPKEGLAFSVDEPKHDKDFLIFHPDNHSPIFLSQVGDYCFFPGSKPVKEACKSQGGTVGCQLSEANQKGEKFPSEDWSMLQSPHHSC